MAQWTQTLEPYIRVHEQVMTMALNPTAGEDLIIGVTFISDAGPSTPTLIRGQKEFLETYTSQDLTQEYIESLNQLYTGDDKTLAATMWANAYRLAGSNTMLCVRASKAQGTYFAKPLIPGDNNTYVLKDGELLRKVPSFKLVIDQNGDSADHNTDGWLISINGVGAFGNRSTDEGTQYDYLVNTLPDLVENLNDTSKFFSPSYKFYTVAENAPDTEVNVDMDDYESKKSVNAVVFNEVYLGADILDTEDERTVDGLSYVITCETDWSIDNPSQNTIELNDPAYSGFTAVPYYSINVYNSATQLGVRIRRFNHDAVITKELTSFEKATLTENGKSPYIVLKDVLDTYTQFGTMTPQKNILDRDFFEIAVMDPSVNGEVSFFNVGNILGRGDMEVSEVNELIKMIQVSLPDDLHDLGLNYYDYPSDNLSFVETDQPNQERWKPIAGGDITPEVIYNANDTNNSFRSLEQMLSCNTNELGLQVGEYVGVEYRESTWSMVPSEESLRGIYNTNLLQPISNPPDHSPSIPTFNSFSDLYSSIMAEYPYNIERDQVYEVRDNSTGTSSYYQLNTTSNNHIINTENGTEEGIEAALGNISGPVPKEVYTVYVNYVHGVDYIYLDTYREYCRYTGLNTYPRIDAITDPQPDTIYTVQPMTGPITNYIYASSPEQLYTNLTIDPTEYEILSVSDSDLKKAMDLIMEDEVYTTEGLSDLGNTELSFQNYLANMAIAETGNYFYPISTVNSTNYMTIGNSATKIPQDSYKLYMSTPWDIDTGTLGWKFYASPSVLYWEAVARNRRNNNEFASLLGQSYGLMQYQRPTTEFNKKTRQLLLSRRVNSLYWNVATQAWNMNDCYTKQNENNIMSEDGNSRLMIRISKAMPVILRQFIGRKITEPLCKEVIGVIDYFFRTTIIPMNVTVDAYQIFCDYDEALARQNKIKVVVNCRYSRSLKFIEVYNRAFDVGMDITNPN